MTSTVIVTAHCQSDTEVVFGLSAPPHVADPDLKYVLQNGESATLYIYDGLTALAYERLKAAADFRQAAREWETDRLRFALKKACEALRQVGNDYPGSSCHRWCHDRADCCERLGGLANANQVPTNG